MEAVALNCPELELYLRAIYVMGTVIAALAAAYVKARNDHNRDLQETIAQLRRLTGAAS